jgi:CBS domain-containing protein
MNQSAKGVPLRPARRVVLHAGAAQRPAPSVSMQASGIAVMTDLDRAPMVTVEAGAQIDDALRLMKHAGVRSAIVVDDAGSLVGLVTANDILGEKPVRTIHSGHRAGAARARTDVHVADVMEPASGWQVVDVDELQRYTVADVVETFRRHGSTHLPVVERSAGGEDRLRGLLSAAEVARRTGADTSGLRSAETFAEIEQAVHDAVLP